MECVVLLLLVAVPYGLCRVFMEVWRAFYDRKRSVATAIGITCIVAGMPVGFMSVYFETQQPSTIQQVFETASITLMFGAGISGAIGVVWDRRIARLEDLPKKP